jgi:hypothetical protein
VVVHSLSWFCLLAATLIARNTWQERPRGQSFLRWRERLHAWKYGHGLDRDTFRSRLLGINPVFWLLSRIRSKPISVWGVLAVLGIAWVWGWWRFRRDWLTEGIYISTAIIVNLLLRCWVAAETGWALAEGRKSGGLELLLSTPLQVEDILRGQWLALRHQFLGPVLAVLFTEFLFMAAIVREAIPDEERVFSYAFWFSGMALFVADLVALYWLGMWRGLTARNGLRAAGGSLAIVLGLPWLGYGLILLLMVLWGFTNRSYQIPPGWAFFVGLWLGLGLTVDLAFGAWARQKLLTEFRAVAQTQLGARSDFLKSWLRTLKPPISGMDPANLDPEIRA